MKKIQEKIGSELREDDQDESGWSLDQCKEEKIEKSPKDFEFFQV